MQWLIPISVKYPAAYRIHVGYCKSHTKTPMAHDIPVLQAPDGRTVSTRLPLGTAQIIAPQPSDARLGEKRYWIICLFTSYAYGGRADPVDQIINNTHAALQDLQRQLRELHEKGAAAPDALYACRFNSGLFAVPWAKTRKLIEDVGPEMTVVYPVNDVNV
ncbi:ADP-ribose 1'-phosphate phosphatase [Penicillium capsulatum]|uniref:ADP-ribose 1'-phosphate phosphatase n=1 Tax=Penicillium capsulatum TaxID=69766 RepID=A0A9W9I215_9EURO|nr:ADP-ribose 1'-phosphate phosphatase [Penicillium capsulatum]